MKVLLIMLNKLNIQCLKPSCDIPTKSSIKLVKWKEVCKLPICSAGRTYYIVVIFKLFFLKFFLLLSPLLLFFPKGLSCGSEIMHGVLTPKRNKIWVGIKGGHKVIRIPWNSKWKCFIYLCPPPLVGWPRWPQQSNLQQLPISCGSIDIWDCPLKPRQLYKGFPKKVKEK